MELEQDSSDASATKKIQSTEKRAGNTTLSTAKIEDHSSLTDLTIVSSHRTSIKLSETEDSRIMEKSRSNGLIKGSLNIIPNDRQLPMYLQDDVEEVLGIAHYDNDSSFHCKSSQTRISGVRTMSNFLDTGDFNHPATVMNPSIHSCKDQFSCISYGSELSLTRSYLHNVHCNYQRLKLRFHKLHEDYYKLIRVAGELTNALENSARGSPVDLPTTLKSCMNVYPDLFNQNVRDDNAEIKSIRSEIEIQQDDLTDSKQPILGIVPVSPKLFDYKKIKLHLINGNVKTKLLLLQALRWKITLSQPAERDEAIHEYTSSDLLGLHGQIASDSGKSILPYLLIPLDVVLPHPLQQSAARLLNTLASLRCGRDYLSVGPTVLNVVIQCLDTAKAETVDGFTCDMIIAMLQKMSLRRQQRLYMIGMGLVEWLIYHLKSESRKIGTYRLEYSIALLMNLSLHREAQVRAATMTTLVLSTLTELLSSAHLPALPYVNGALNNFLANHTINEEAKKIGLESVLEYHRRRNSGEIRKHLEHILRRHRREANESIEDNIMIADDDSEELDVLENELDELDPVKVHAGELFGEALLATCYSVSLIDRHRSSLDVQKISPRSSQLNPPKQRKQSPNSGLKNSKGSSPLEKIVSPRYILNRPDKHINNDGSRLTPTNRRLTSKNTAPLRILESHERIIKNSRSPLNMKTNSTAKVQKTHLHSPKLDADSRNEIKSLLRKIDVIRNAHRPTEHAKDSKSASVNSTTTLISAYESAAEADDRMSSIASQPAESETQKEMLEPKNQTNAEIEEEAFLSKPRVMRTPPQSAVLRALSSLEDEVVDDETLQ